MCIRDSLIPPWFLVKQAVLTVAAGFPVAAVAGPHSHTETLETGSLKIVEIAKAHAFKLLLHKGQQLVV